MKHIVRITIAVAIMLTFALTRGPSTKPAEQSITESKPVASGYRAQIDPATGDFIAPTEPVSQTQYPLDVQDALSTSPEGLEQVDAPVGGGKMVNLQGRFQHTYTAGIDDKGSVRASCDLPALKSASGE